MRTDSLLAIAAWTLIAVLGAGPAIALEFNVNVLTDEISGPCDLVHCTLREAVIDANGTSGDDTINLPAGVFVLTVDGGGIGTHEDDALTGDLDIRDDVTLSGSGRDLTIIDADRLDRVFHIPVTGIAVTFEDLTIRGGGGISQGGVGGGGILSDASDVIVRDSDIIDNRTGLLFGVDYAGGGINIQGGTLDLVRSLVADNRATYDGGISFNSAGNLTIFASTIAYNTASVDTGGLMSSSASAAVTSSTIAHNTAINGFYGGIFNQGQMDILESTVAWNSTDIEIETYGTTGGLTNLTNSIVEGRCTGGFDQYDTGGGNVYGDPTHCEVGPDDLNANRTVHLGTLGDHGGPTPTILPYPHSPVIDHSGGDAACTIADQRGVLRPQDGNNDGMAHCDAGAVEYAFGEMIFGDGFEFRDTSWWSVSEP